MLSSMSAFANTQFETYTIIYGGGVDDLGLGLTDQQGKEYHAYCSQQCGDWFEFDQDSLGEKLKNQFKGRQAVVDLSYEINAGRIVGPGDEDELYFIKSIKLIDSNQRKPWLNFFDLKQN